MMDKIYIYVADLFYLSQKEFEVNKKKIFVQVSKIFMCTFFFLHWIFK